MNRVCTLCEEGDPIVFFERSRIPLSANVLFSRRDAALAARNGQLSLAVCRRCGFVFNAAFDPSAEIYGAEYDNDQGFSERFTAHVHQMADRVRKAAPKHLRALEVGCGQGQFLEALLAEGGEGLGFDPSLRRESTDRIRLVADCLERHDAEALAFRANVGCTRHVIEHIWRPIEFLSALRKVLRGQALLFVETPCVRHILETGAFWDLCYEHCSYFSKETLALACRRAGFAVRGIEHVFGGQYLLLEGQCDRPRDADPSPPPHALIERFRDRTRALCSHWRQAVENASRSGPVAIWGGGTKGATFAQLIDPDGSLVHSIIDINPRKQGRYLAGTGHRICDWRYAIADGVRTAVVMNANYMEEIRDTVSRSGAELGLICVEAPTSAGALN